MFEDYTIDTSLNGFLSYFKFLFGMIILGIIFTMVLLKIAELAGYSAQDIIMFMVGV